jgi:hypothetical protein
MTASVHWPLKVIAFNANGSWRQRYEVSKQLQGLYIDVALLSETHLKPHQRLFFQIINFIVTTASQQEKAIPTTK